MLGLIRTFMILPMIYVQINEGRHIVKIKMIHTTSKSEEESQNIILKHLIELKENGVVYKGGKGGKFHIVKN